MDVRYRRELLSVGFIKKLQIDGRMITNDGRMITKNHMTENYRK